MPFVIKKIKKVLQNGSGFIKDNSTYHNVAERCPYYYLHV